MEKIAINPNRLAWCCETLEIDVSLLYKDIRFAENTIANAMKGKKSLTINQLQNIAKYFNRSLLFFLEPKDVNYEKVYSPQFRTINNQKPLHSRKINTLIENVEQHRKIYLNLLNELGTPMTGSWHPEQINSTDSTKQSADNAREWLGIRDNLDFNELRALVESKGIMVFVSNGYSGKWQIGKDSSVRGFALYYEILPIIVIKKQISKGAQAFTLLHELAHLLLHKESILDENKDFYTYSGKEKQANEFSSNTLMPDNSINTIDLNKLQNLDIHEYDDFLEPFKKRWCVSGDAILYRLFRDNKITKVHYQAYRDLKEKQTKEKKLKEERQKQLGTYKPPPRMYRHREPVNIFGRAYVGTVLDALQNKHITLSKASTYLDNLKIRTLHKLEGDFV
ncbi:ImmA/IrrE family metallo-endopeptidase [Bathymodiolus septemdierum thioautotrophic gill symbiont]|uniref:IrrE N-terminal-like domain-containing protein n=1 Tax=endosymbiont of Bathymodiolus septemdierum str. Myojin knoll TaxID=1303921 RepID=A0A0P0UTH2_9GAMM|nr:ImmA/IrrE family metallo-endopeptidase [Bathymodiolus septemdierum thioautotrophic gill symbiont]BAS68478.1 conserved hypothetical protein [endosymbiont of Bathymodiolus septemdierum str. Myojin knoll]